MRDAGSGKREAGISDCGCCAAAFRVGVYFNALPLPAPFFPLPSSRFPLRFPLPL